MGKDSLLVKKPPEKAARVQESREQPMLLTVTPLTPAECTTGFLILVEMLV